MLAQKLHRLLTVLMTVGSVAVGQHYDDTDGRACDQLFAVDIKNQTDIDFYKTCTTITSHLLYVDLKFKGPFVLPGVESAHKVVAGLYLPKIGPTAKEDEDFTTSITMPDLKNITATGLSIAYLDNLTSISFPKLTDVTGGVAIMDNFGLKNMSFPALTTVKDGLLIDLDLDEISFPSLKTVTYLRIVSGGNINCPDLGQRFANLTFTPGDHDLYSGFTCYTPYKNNYWNSSDPKHNPTPGSSSIATFGNQSPDSDSAASTSHSGIGQVVTALLLAVLTI